jgi:hypothetical protein
MYEYWDQMPFPIVESFIWIYITRDWSHSDHSYSQQLVDDKFQPFSTQRGCL